MTTLEKSFAGKFAYGALCIFAGALASSISVAQIGLGIVFFIFLFGLATRSGRMAMDFSALGRFKNLYAVFFLWVFWRTYHVLISPQPLQELIEAREVWLMLIPLFIYLYAKDRGRLRTILLFYVAGVAVPSAISAWRMRADFFNMVRGHGLTNMHHLNYAGHGALAVMMCVGCVWGFCVSGSKKNTALAVVFTFVSGVGLWLTKSKGVIASFILVVPLFIYWQLFNRAQRLIFVGVISVLAVIVVPGIPSGLVEQFRFPPPEVHVGSQAERRDLWQAGIQMIKGRPVAGWGDRGYNLSYPKYQVPGAMLTAAYDEKNQSASHMHNDFINTWVLYGAVGLLLQLLYYFLGVGAYLRERFRIRQASDRPLAAAAASSAILMALMGLTQCHFTSEIVQMSFWLTVGVLFTVLESDRAGFELS